MVSEKESKAFVGVHLVVDYEWSCDVLPDAKPLGGPDADAEWVVEAAHDGVVAALVHERIVANGRRLLYDPQSQSQLLQ